ncbi:MAG: DNA-directed RNA polymerase subunit omega [Candidatus Scalindua sp.]
MTKRIDKLTQDIGQFHMTTLIIKRARELMAGAPALVETDSSDPVKTAFEEFESGKISITDEVLTKD